MPKNIRLNSTRYSIMKFQNKREFRQIAFKHSSDIYFIDIMNLYKNFTAKPYSFLVIDAILASAVNIARNLLFMLNNLQQIHLELLRKDWFRKQQKLLLIWLVIKLLKKLQKSQKRHNRIIQKQLQMSMIKKYLKKDIYLQKKDRKLLMIWD